MVSKTTHVKVDLIFVALYFIFSCMVESQYERYNFTNLPQENLIPIASVYGQALDHYAAKNWTDCINYMQLSLRLHQLLINTMTYCTLHCDEKRYDLEPLVANGDLKGFWHVLMQASCLKKCRAHFPNLLLLYPSNEIMEDFERRTPYRYLHFAHFHMNNLQRAVPCAYTYLQRNPDDSEMSQQMKTYQSQYDLEGYLLDYEERPHQVTFLKAVTLLNIEDLSGGLGHMEQALSQYLQEYDLCQAVCEGAMEVSLVKNLYPCPADAYVDALRCKVKCEDNLKPNVGGFFVEQFVATMYHYLQYAYYKLNDVRSAAPCASSFTLFHPEDEVMKQNVLYYQSYTQQYGLNNTHFKPRTEAVKYHDQIATQRQMLLQAEDYLRMNDEYFLGPQEAVVDVADSLDIEFEGLGDYEEAFYAKWWQPKGKGDIGNSEI